MMISGLAMFYAGLVRVKNVLSVYMQCFAITAVVTVLWTIFGYSLAFDKVGMQAGEDGIHAFRGTLQSIYEGYYAR
jgi:Amt family ammonium transporter